MRLSQINNTVERFLLARHPHLVGHVTVDTRFSSISFMACVFITEVTLKGSASYLCIMENPERLPSCYADGDERRHPLANLADYRGYEGEMINIDSLELTIGDGDDKGAVTFPDVWTASIWVRALNLSQGVIE